MNAKREILANELYRLAFLGFLSGGALTGSFRVACATGLFVSVFIVVLFCSMSRDSKVE